MKLFLQGGQFLLVLVDFFGAQFIAYIMAIAEIVAVCWIYGNLLVIYLFIVNLMATVFQG